MGTDPSATADNSSAPQSPRNFLLSTFRQALEAADGRRCVRAALDETARQSAWCLIAVGKAASAMTLGAFDALGDRVSSALVISRDGHFDPELQDAGRARLFASSHPLPDERSLAAGEILLDAVRGAARDERLLFLISGGASSLVEALPPNVPLEALREYNHWALSQGLTIGEINAGRSRLSSIKGGRLLDHLEDRDVLALFVSDVPADDPSLIGSGLLGEPRPAPLPANLPEHLARIMRNSPPARTAARLRIRRQVVATLDDAMDAAVRAGESAGLGVRRADHRFDGDAVALATRFCHELVLSEAQLLVWGGESTVRLPDSPGRGGRNQHLALAAARLLVGHEELALLSAGTDGTDGPTEDAGALVDSSTIERGTLDALDADDCLLRADSATFLEAAGDLVHTGPTGTNVGDLVLGLKTRR